MLLRGKERSYSPGTQLCVFQAIPSSGEDVSSEAGGTFEQKQLLFMGTSRPPSALCMALCWKHFFIKYTVLRNDTVRKSLR